MRRADVQLVAFLGNLPQSPMWGKLGEGKAPGEGHQQERKKARPVQVLFPWVLSSTGTLLALEGLESSTQALASHSESQLCSTLATNFCQGKEDLADVAFF